MESGQHGRLACYTNKVAVIPEEKEKGEEGESRTLGLYLQILM